MDHQTQQPGQEAPAPDSAATFGGPNPLSNDDFRTDYALRVGAAPDHDGVTNPIRAGGATHQPAFVPHYAFLQPALEPGEIGRLGNYRVLRLLGQGGMAFVFLAEDLDLRRKVALKIMKPDLEDIDSWHRFLREARIMASIKHEHLVPVFQVAREGRVHYLAMELLEGETLESWSNRTGQATPSDLVRLARGIASGLATIHRQGLVHRDIKPGNLWLEGARHHVKILDLGLARSVADDAHFTQTGVIVGTPAFMSPEQARGDRIDGRSDLFSLGAVLYRMAAGRLPFDAPTTMGVLSELAVCNPRPVREHNPALPRALANLIMQLLAKDPELRPNSAEVVLEVLKRIESRRAEDREPAAAQQIRAGAAPQAEPIPERRQRPRNGATKKRGPANVMGVRRWVAVSVAIAAAVAVVAGVAVILTVGIMAWTDPGHARAEAGAKVFLSDLKPTDVILGGPAAPEKGPPMFKKGPPQFKDFRYPRVNQQKLTHGILMHPLPMGDSAHARQSYPLDGQFSALQAEVSLNDGPFQSETPLTFTVLGDGQPLWKSQPLLAQRDRQKCTVSVKNVRLLTIRVDCPGEPRGAHAVWIDPHLVK